MKITESEFVISVNNKNNLIKGDMPEIVFVGRSNVGKSSLINAICNKKNLAKTSSTPGRTRLINYFKINKTFLLVDLPGYGYASGVQKEVNDWGTIIKDYFEYSKNIRAVFVLLDVRRTPSDKDIQMINYLIYKNLPYKLCITKADKLSKSAALKNIKVISDVLKTNVSEMIVTSSEKHTNIDLIVQAIQNYIEC